MPLKSDSSATLAPQEPIEVMIVAAEASSSLYAQRLLEYWQDHGQKVHAFGVGSRDMEALGFEILGRSENLAVVGLTEVIKHYGEIKGVFESLVVHATDRRPRLILLLDYPDFNLRLAKRLKALNIPIVYYISPQVWAWRKSRIRTIQKVVDKMLVVLPFEKDFYKNHGVDVEFVGHPILDEIHPQLFDKQERKAARERYGVNEHEIWVGLMPGSRNSEIRHHLQTQLQAAEVMYQMDKRLKFALLVAPTFSVDMIRGFLPSYSLPLTLIKDEPMKMVSLVDVVLCASGTATLTVGLMKKPMVIMYKMNWLTAFLAKLFVKGTAHFGLINLILGREVVPELFQEEANPRRLADEVLKIINENSRRALIEDELSRAHEVLGRRGATERVAEILNRIIVG